MNVKFPKVDDKYIKDQVGSGFFTNETELVRAAVRRMREEEQEQKLEALRAAVMVGHEQIVKGDTVPYTKNFTKDALKRAEENHKNGKSIKADVQPE